MDLSAYRQPTTNEAIYLKKYLKNRKKAYRFGVYFLAVMLIMIIATMVYTCFCNVNLMVHLLTVALLMIPAVLILWLIKNFHQIAMVSNVEDDMYIVPIEGSYKFTRGNRRYYIVHYIGNYSVSMPNHWFRYLHEGDYVKAEAYFFPATINLSKQEMITTNPACTLVSLNDTYFIDREVSQGLMQLKTPVNFLIGISAGILGLIIGSILLAGGSSPFIGYPKFQYDHKKLTEFKTVAELTKSPYLAGDKVLIAKAALALDLETVELYLFDPLTTDGEVIVDSYHDFLNKKEAEQKKQTERENLLQEFQNIQSFQLTKKEAWNRFKIFKGNSDYEFMKNWFLTEGKQFYEEQRTIAFQKLRDNKDLSHVVYLVELNKLSAKYREQFVNSEENNIRDSGNIFQEELEGLLIDLYLDFSKSRPRVKIEYNIENISNFDHSLAQVIPYLNEDQQINNNETLFLITENYQGMLEINHQGDLVINQKLERTAKLDMVLSLNFLIVSLLALLFGISGIGILLSNRRIIHKLTTLYE